MYLWGIKGANEEGRRKQSSPLSGQPYSEQFAHCGKIGHIKVKCFEIVGYPPNWDMCRTQRGTGRPSGQNTAHYACDDESQKKEHEQNAGGHALYATRMNHKAMYGNVTMLKGQYWVLDSGASHHMTYLFDFLFINWFSTMNGMTFDIIKVKMFEGGNFDRWEKEMHVLYNKKRMSTHRLHQKYVYL